MKLNISHKIPFDLAKARYLQRPPGSAEYPVGIVGWIAEDNTILICDNCDIWQLDPTTRQNPISITHSFGRDHHIKFRVLGGYSESESLMIKTYSRKDTIILFAFNELNKIQWVL